MAEKYFGKYMTFTSEDKNDGVMFLGPDHVVGAPYTVEFKHTDDGTVAWCKSQHGGTICHFDEKGTDELSLCFARDWTVHLYLSFVAWDEDPEPGRYWGQMAVVAYDKSLAAEMEVFEKNLQKALSNGTRPKLSMGEGALEQLINTKGAWFPTDREKKPKLTKRQAMVKDQQTMNDRIVEGSRSGNKGCYAGTIVFYIALAAVVIFGLKSCGVF